MNVRQAAYDAYDAGLCVLPPREDGSKAPLGAKWKHWQQGRPSKTQLEAWYGAGVRQGLGVLCGRVSGDLECFEFDDQETYYAYHDLAEAVGLGELLERVEAGYSEATPGDGVHLLYRCEATGGNTKLARRPKRPEEMRDPDDKIKTLIETRDEGGFVITAPSFGRVHPSGKSYRLLRGRFDTILTITPEDRRALHELAMTFDAMPMAEVGPTGRRTSIKAERPGDVYNAQGSWPELLLQHGWTWVYRREEVDFWRRPGKDIGVSATTNYAASDLLYVFTSSSLFEPERSYSKFAAYAVLEHNGDYKAAAKALAAQAQGKAGSGNEDHEHDDVLEAIHKHGIERVLAEELTVKRGERFARDPGQRLYRYRNGAYRARGELLVERAVKGILESWDKSIHWRSTLAEHVCAYIRADAPELWEQPPQEEVCLENGILNVVTRELRPHTPAWLSTLQLPIRFDPEAVCPANELFMSQVYAEDAYEAGVPWELEATFMLPATGNRKADLFLGEGGTGKSTRLERLKRFLGSGNTVAMSLHRIENDRFSVVQLYGRLANICPDLPSQHLETTSTFKAITGGDALTGEYKFKDSFSFTPFCHVAFSANQPPRAQDASEAFFDRWRVHPFNKRFRGTGVEVPQQALLERLSTPEELSGVLNKALDALKRIRQRGYAVTASMRDAFEDMREITDPLAVWCSRKLVEHSDAVIALAEVRAAFDRYARENGIPSMTETAFGLAMKRRYPHVGIKQRTVKGRLLKCYIGLGLAAESPPGPSGSTGFSSMFPTNRTREPGNEPLWEQDRRNPVNLMNPVEATASRVCIVCGKCLEGADMCAACEQEGAAR